MANFLLTAFPSSKPASRRRNSISDGIHYLVESEVRGHTCCAKCQSIPWKELIEASLKKMTFETGTGKIRRPLHSPKSRFVVHATLNQFKTAADYCTLCRHLWNWFQHTGKGGECLLVDVFLCKSQPPSAWSWISLRYHSLEFTSWSKFTGLQDQVSFAVNSGTLDTWKTVCDSEFPVFGAHLCFGRTVCLGNEINYITYSL